MQSSKTKFTARGWRLQRPQGMRTLLQVTHHHTASANAALLFKELSKFRHVNMRLAYAQLSAPAQQVPVLQPPHQSRSVAHAEQPRD